MGIKSLGSRGGRQDSVHLNEVVREESTLPRGWLLVRVQLSAAAVNCKLRGMRALQRPFTSCHRASASH